MSLSTNKALVKSFVEEVFNNHDISATEKYLAGQGNKEFKQFKESLTPFFTAFPDIHANIEHIVAENDLVVVFLNWTGTHKGEFQGRLGFLFLWLHCGIAGSCVFVSYAIWSLLSTLRKLLKILTFSPKY